MSYAKNEEVSVIVRKSEGYTMLQQSCISFSDQTEDHLWVILGIMTSSMSANNIEATNRAFETILEYLSSIGERAPDGMLNAVRIVLSDMYLSTFNNPIPIFRNIISINLKQCRPSIVLGVFVPPQRI